MDIDKIVALNVRNGRKRLNLTQEMLAERAGVSSRYIGSVERAAVSVTVTVLSKVAAALEVEPGELLRPPNKKKRKL
jgi:transcriptional regulator with XRE-family HTH domain